MPVLQIPEALYEIEWSRANTASWQKGEILQLWEFYLDKELQYRTAGLRRTSGLIWSACLFCILTDLYSKAPAEPTEVRYSCRRSGWFFWETHEHGTVTLVILIGWLGALTGQCEPKLLSPVSTRMSALIKNGSAVKPSTTSALRGITSCSV